MESRPHNWFKLSSGYKRRSVQKLLGTLVREWPWNLADCRWTAGKVFMALQESTWKEFEKTQGVSVKEPHLRMLKLSPDEAEAINCCFVKAYKKTINSLTSTT
jgi:hypothetical protein